MMYTKEYTGFLDQAQEKRRAEEVRRRVSERFPGGARAFVHAYGCQQNVSDAQRLEGLLAALGFSMTDDARAADLILLNTCAVRENAENRVLGNIGAMKSIKEARPGMIIAVCGCMTQQPQVAAKIKKSYTHVDLVFGANAAHRLPALLLELLEGRARIVDDAPPGEEIIEGLPERRRDGVRAWLPIMQGCDNFCTYCIVPYVRGRERSRRMPDVLREAHALLDEGYKEITLLGQNVNSYGKGLEENTDFPTLLRALNEIEGDFRVRFMTSHPKDCTRALIDAVAACPKVCSHIHLPVQSGSDRILARMNRRYTAAQYRELIDYARERIPGVSFTSDIIVGFPGETYDDFLETLELVRGVGYTSLFTFLYSPRSGTKAAEMEDPVPRGEKTRWFRELLDLQEKMGRAVHEAQVGSVLRVLVEEPGKEPGILSGHTESGIIVQFAADPALIGQFVDVRIIRALNWALCGEIEKNGAC